MIFQSTWLVVLNWNGRDDTLELLDSLAGEPATVLLVDNASDDGTLEAVSSRFPDVQTLQTGANLGYAGGNNVGIAHAIANGAEIIGVLNNDTVVEPGFLAPLVATLGDSGKIAVSPDIRYAETPDVSWFRGSRIDLRTGWPHHLAPGEQPAGAAPFESPVLTGCCIVASASTWQNVGTFDDGMFLMFEDSDWSRRAAGKGVRLLVVPESRIRHKVSRSFTGSAELLGSFYFARNGTVFAWRRLGRRATIRFVWRQIIRPSIRRMFDATLRPAVVMSYLGLAAALANRRGRAGTLVTRYAGRAVRDRG